MYFSRSGLLFKTPQLRYQRKQLDITICEFPLHNLHQLQYPINGTIKKNAPHRKPRQKHYRFDNLHRKRAFIAISSSTLGDKGPQRP